MPEGDREADSSDRPVLIGGFPGLHHHSRITDRPIALVRMRLIDPALLHCGTFEG
jgi:hypothetical protein